MEGSEEPFEKQLRDKQLIINMSSQRKQLLTVLRLVESDERIIAYKTDNTTQNVKDFRIYLSVANRGLRLRTIHQKIYDKFCSDVNEALTSILKDNGFTTNDINPIFEQEKITQQRHHEIVNEFIYVMLINLNLDENDSDYQLLLQNLDDLYRLWFKCFFNIVAFMNYIPVAYQTKDRSKILDFLHTYNGNPNLMKGCDISSLVRKR